MNRFHYTHEDDHHFRHHPPIGTCAEHSSTNSFCSSAHGDPRNNFAGDSLPTGSTSVRSTRLHSNGLTSTPTASPVPATMVDNFCRLMDDVLSSIHDRVLNDITAAQLRALQRMPHHVPHDAIMALPPDQYHVLSVLRNHFGPTSMEKHPYFFITGSAGTGKPSWSTPSSGCCRTVM